MKSFRQNRLIFTSIILIGILIAFLLLDLFIGSVHVPVGEIINILISSSNADESIQSIILDFRLPKVITAILVGIALSVSGLQMQSVFRNPLAGPYVMGISSGASLGVAVLLLGSGWISSQMGLFTMGNWSMAIAAWAGSALVLLLVLMVSYRVKDILTVLILGIMFGAAVTSLVSVLQYFSDEQSLKTYIVWTMGSLGGVTKSQLNVLIPIVLIGLLLAILSAKMLNALLLGESYAKSMGVNVLKARVLVFLSTSLLAGSVTAFCGPIGFIGIAVPHIARIVFKTSDTYVLLWGSTLIGIIFMLISDLLSKLPGYDAVLPINSVTAILGVPVVIYIIIKRYRFES